MTEARPATIPLSHLSTGDASPSKFRLLQQVRHAVRLKGYSVRTEDLRLWQRFSFSLTGF